MNARVQWLPDGSARSSQFNDIYRSRSGALAQANTVFLAGCGLPQAWASSARFSILETGFGLGLNFLATWAAWQTDPQRCGVLEFISLEAYPVDASDILRSAQELTPRASPQCAQINAKEAARPRADKRTLACQPVATQSALVARLAELAGELAAAWGSLKAGKNLWLFDRGRVHLCIYVGAVQPMLAGFTDRVEAVYLDGFSPACNPEMWSAQTLYAVKQHCQPGTRLATYSVAASVRHSLQALGFAVRTMPGLAPKRERLEAIILDSSVDRSLVPVSACGN